MVTVTTKATSKCTRNKRIMNREGERVRSRKEDKSRGVPLTSTEMIYTTWYLPIEVLGMVVVLLHSRCVRQGQMSERRDKTKMEMEMKTDLFTSHLMVEEEGDLCWQDRKGRQGPHHQVAPSDATLGCVAPHHIVVEVPAIVGVHLLVTLLLSYELEVDGVQM
jgi:hypothetical protein